jgi:hypothetical protein
VPEFFAYLDLHNSELRNARVHLLGAEPAGAEGLLMMDTVVHKLKYHNGTSWITVESAGAGMPATLFDANTILKADVDNTPQALTVSEGTVVGRLAGGSISAVSAADLRTLLGALNLFTAPTSSLGLNSQRITSLASPIDPTDAANRAYVDAVATGLDVKESVRAATTANINLAAPGATIDGVTLAAGDRVLVKNQTAPNGEQNGIYVFDTAATPMVRAGDADSPVASGDPLDVTAGMFTFVTEGDTQADQGWVLTTDDPIFVGTTDLTFTQFSGPGSVVGTTNRITVTGNQVDIAGTYVGQASITTVGALVNGSLGTGFTDVAVAEGGTGASTAAGAKTNLGFLTRYAVDFGTVGDLSYDLTHSLNTLDVAVELYTKADGKTAYADVTRLDVNTIRVAFANAPGANAIRAVVIG